MKPFALIIILLSLSLISRAQDLNQTIRGKVIDQELESEIIGARVFAFSPTGDTLKQATDLDGNFAFRNIPIGRYTLVVSMMGYETRFLSDILLSSGKEQVLNVWLQESTKDITELVIKGNDGHEVDNDMAVVSARSFSMEEASRYAGSFNDPARMAQSFAGVSSNNDGENEIVIRGNSPRGVLWRLEGVEIPNPNHFADQGASGGAISMINSNVMANSDFYTGAFPADYGNAISGVFDIRFRKGNNEKREYALGAGVLGVDASLEGPFSKNYNGSYLINYRYSTTKILSLMKIDVAGDALPIFQDLSYNISLPTKNAGNFTVFGLGGISQIEEDEEDYRSDFTMKMGTTGITHRIMLGDKSVLKTVVSVSGTLNDIVDYELDSLNVFYNDWNRKLTNTSLIGSSSLTTKLNSRHTIKFGVIANHMAFDMLFDNINEDTWQRETYLKSKGNTQLLQSFAAWKWRITPELSLNAGLHGTHFVLNSYQTIEPRAGLKWQLNDQQSINGGFGIHSRREDLGLYFGEQTLADGSKIMANKNLEFAKAIHYVIGHDITIKKLHIKTEAYYQTLNNVPIIDHKDSYVSAINFGSAFTTDSLSNAGTGENYGVELTVEKYFSDSYFFMFTGSLFNSSYVAGDGKKRNTRYNGNYATNLTFGKEYYVGKNGKNNTLSFNFRMNWAGGRRITPILLDQSIAAGEEIRDENNVFSKRASDYFRLDFLFSYKTNKAKSTRVLKVDIQNVTNRGNMWNEYYSDNTQSILKSTQMGLLPVIAYQIIF